MVRARPLLLLVLPMALGCGDTLNLVSATLIKIESPVANGTLFSQDPLDFRVTATNQTGVATLDLSAGTVLLKTCTGDTGNTLSCEVTAALSDIAAQIHDGKLHLSVTATDRKNRKVKKTAGIDVFVKPIRVRFTSPVASGDPLVATVQGTSTLSLDVASEVALDSVSVVDEQNLPLVSFSGSDALSAEVNWPVKLKVGDHELTATATDAQRRTDHVYLPIRVLCAQDADCPDPHQTCATATGTCH